MEFLEEPSPHTLHIVTFQEEEKILRTAIPYMRVLVVVILETGMRSHREALALREWDSITAIAPLFFRLWWPFRRNNYPFSATFSNVAL